MSEEEKTIAMIRAVVSAFYTSEMASRIANFAIELRNNFIKKGFSIHDATELTKSCLGFKGT